MLARDALGIGCRFLALVFALDFFDGLTRSMGMLQFSPPEVATMSFGVNWTYQIATAVVLLAAVAATWRMSVALEKSTWADALSWRMRQADWLRVACILLGLCVVVQSIPGGLLLLVGQPSALVGGLLGPPDPRVEGLKLVLAMLLALYGFVGWRSAGNVRA